LLLSTISGSRDYFTTACDDSTDWDFSARRSRLGLRNGCRHEGAVVGVKNPFWQH